MRYRVLKPFINIDGGYLKLNDSIECSDNRARVLRNNGIIGNRVIEQAVKISPIVPEKEILEKAIDIKPKSKRGRKKKAI